MNQIQLQIGPISNFFFRRAFPKNMDAVGNFILVLILSIVRQELVGEGFGRVVICDLQDRMPRLGSSHGLVDRTSTADRDREVLEVQNQALLFHRPVAE